jgi:nucleoside-diphosphate-sugar epimerase
MCLKCAVTGVSGYTGKYITQRLITRADSVINLTGHSNNQTIFGDCIKSYPYSFDNSDRLIETLKDIDVLFNTYWIRYPQNGITFEIATENSIKLIKAAKEAGVKKIVHISITNPSMDSKYSYFKGKAIVEDAIIKSGINYSILRPTVIFGNEGVLFNNIAWFIRHLHVFGIPGSEKYHLNPIFVEDIADLAVKESLDSECKIMDAVGPDNFTMIELVNIIKSAVNTKCLLLHTSTIITYLVTSILGIYLKDKILTYDELGSLQDNLLSSTSTAAGKTSFCDWIKDKADVIGKNYFIDARK